MKIIKYDERSWSTHTTKDSVCLSTVRLNIVKYHAIQNNIQIQCNCHQNTNDILHQLFLQKKQFKTHIESEMTHKKINPE